MLGQPSRGELLNVHRTHPSWVRLLRQLLPTLVICWGSVASISHTVVACHPASGLSWSPESVHQEDEEVGLLGLVPPPPSTQHQTRRSVEPTGANGLLHTGRPARDHSASFRTWIRRTFSAQMECPLLGAIIMREEDSVAQLLLIDHDVSESSRLATFLEGQRHEVRVAHTGSEGITLALTGNPQVILLDLALQDCSSLAVLKMLKSAGPVPVIACGTERQVVAGLGAGANGYMRTPFSADLAAAVIKSTLSACEPTGEPAELTVGDLHIDMRAHCATLNGRHLNLRPKEFSLLSYLARHAGRVVSKQELISHVWGNAFGSTAKTIDVHLSWLRRRLGESAARPRYLYSVRGVGIKFSVPGCTYRRSATHSSTFSIPASHHA
ncbi:winged helix-turn-helix domain-containing protein [Streptomyces sp. NPDC008121]|uniref:response regulator transcription factor n=1 Tax=Streptomyces sp. NPDC008121 TaxID=3364809 RepID=UPI0036E60296